MCLCIDKVRKVCLQSLTHTRILPALALVGMELVSKDVKALKGREATVLKALKGRETTVLKALRTGCIDIGKARHRLSLQVKDVVLVVNAQARVGKDTARRNSKLGPLQSLSSLDLWQISHVDGGRRNYICSALSSPSQPEKPAIFHGGAALAPALDLHSTYTSTNSHTSVA